jgi:hypothetical protein
LVLSEFRLLTVEILSGGFGESETGAKADNGGEVIFVFLENPELFNVGFGESSAGDLWTFG